MEKLCTIAQVARDRGDFYFHERHSRYLPLWVILSGYYSIDTRATDPRAKNVADDLGLSGPVVARLESYWPAKSQVISGVGADQADHRRRTQHDSRMDLTRVTTKDTTEDADV